MKGSYVVQYSVHNLATPVQSEFRQTDRHTDRPRNKIVTEKTAIGYPKNTLGLKAEVLKDLT